MKFYKWFTPVPETLEDLKKMYKRLARENHPDMGGSTQAMQEINAEYEALSNGGIKDSRGNPETAEQASAFIKIIEELFKVPGIKVELCGTWLWASGNTYPVHETLKVLGFKYQSKKKMWYWAPPGSYIRHGRKTATMDEIRSKYGSQVLLETADDPDADKKTRRKTTRKTNSGTRTNGKTKTNATAQMSIF